MRTRRGHSYSSTAGPVSRPSKRARLTLNISNDVAMTDGDHNPNDYPAGSSSDVAGCCSSNRRFSTSTAGSINRFDTLPEDLLLSIFVCVSSTATSPSDLLAARRTCKKFNALAMHPLVLSKASLCGMEVKAPNWCESSYRYLKRCAESGNVEACYTLGMIRFYCIQAREDGIMWMSRAAKVSHPCALHSLAVIQFNGSGGARKHKNLKAGVSLCARAASLGHIDAMRELGHCLQDGYGISRNVLEGRKLLLEANAREAAAAVTSNLGKTLSGQALQLTATKIAIGCFHHHFLCTQQQQPPANQHNINNIHMVQQQQHQDHHQQQQHDPRRPDPHRQYHDLEDQAHKLQAALHRHPLYKLLQSGGCSLLSDFGCNVPPPKLHPCHRFLVDWFSLHPPTSNFRLCSHQHCGRPETRRHEFRRCSACGKVNYCSRACQALDWKLRHKFVCVPAANWHQRGAVAGAPIHQQQQQQQHPHDNPLPHHVDDQDDVENF